MKVQLKNVIGLGQQSGVHTVLDPRHYCQTLDHIAVFVQCQEH